MADEGLRWIDGSKGELLGGRHCDALLNKLRAYCGNESMDKARDGCGNLDTLLAFNEAAAQVDVIHLGSYDVRCVPTDARPVLGC